MGAIGIVSQDGSGHYRTITEAIAAAENAAFNHIFIKNGIYKEKIVINKPNLILVGESKENVIVTFSDGAFAPDETGKPMGTLQTYTVKIEQTAAGFDARNITFQNEAGPGHLAGQAVAVYADADRVSFRDCRFLARQDTLLCGPVPAAIEQNPTLLYRQYYRNCYIEGDVDFIFGGATAVFDRCEIFALDRGKPINAYLTAACTSKSLPYGFTFFDCCLTGSADAGTVSLGRPWRDHARTVFIRCFMGALIKKEGFTVWEGTNRHENCYYAQYQCCGPGCSPETRAAFSHILTDEEARTYTVQAILKDWDLTQQA